MTTPNKTEEVIENEVDIRTPSERAADQQVERLEEFFASIQSGSRILIERLRPSWCSGLLEEITVTDDLALEYFIENWGGQLLSVKIRGTGGKIHGRYLIPLYTYDPLRWGKILKQPNIGDRYDPQSVPTTNQPQQIVLPNPPEPKSDPMIPLLMQMLQGQRNREIELMNALMNARQSPQSGANFGDLAALGTTFTQLREVFRNTESGGDDMTALLPQVIDVIKGITNKTPSAPPIPSKLVAPRITNPPPATVTPLRAPNPNPDIAQTIADMPAEQAAKTLIRALGTMNENKRAEAIKIFVPMFTGEDIGADDGDEYEDEDDYSKKSK